MSVPIVEVRVIDILVYLFVDGVQQPMCWTGDERHNADTFAATILRQRYEAYNREQRLFRRSGVTFDSFAVGVSERLRTRAVGFGQQGVL